MDGINVDVQLNWKFVQFLINIIFYNKGQSDTQTLFGTSRYEGYKLKLITTS
jgi:hypothetical protein